MSRSRMTSASSFEYPYFRIAFLANSDNGC
jgi:hypothetical protein